MNRAAWARPTTAAEAHARAAGRRRYNAVRALRAELRRLELVALARRHGVDLTRRGARAHLARLLGVHRSTAARDVLVLVTRHRPCPTCGAPIPG